MGGVGACSTSGEGKGKYRVLVGEKNERQRSVRRWEYNFKMYVQKVGWSGKNWIDLSQDEDR